MNHILMVALLVLVAGSHVQARGGGHGGGGGSHGKSACHKALEPTNAERTELQAAITTCIAEQPGLQAIITSLRGSGHHWKHGGGARHRDVATLLENNGYTTEATVLRTCIAREMGLVKTDGTFDMDTLKASILAKVTGLAIAPNTQLGLDNCPVVVNFNVVTYLLCIMTYCETGVAG